MASDTATVTSRSMVNIPAKIRKKYSIKSGTKLRFIETGKGGIEIIPLPKLSDLFGIDRENKETLLEGIKELHRERRHEAVRERKKPNH
jgi:AbrB family looped-hinge helix DNA binding protein